MNLVTLTVATDKVEFRCNAELTEAERTAAMERLTRLTQTYPEITRMYVDVERDSDSEDAAFVAKGQVGIEGPDLLASVADPNALTAIEFLLENFDRQLRRQKLKTPRARASTSLRAPRSNPPARS
jgi:ribosome-associated translation inhibitor RaiA